MFLKHHFDYIILLLKIFASLSTFFRTTSKFLAVAFESHLVACRAFFSTSLTSHATYCIFSRLCTSSPDAKHMHFLPFIGTKLLQKLPCLTLVNYVFVSLFKSVEADGLGTVKNSLLAMRCQPKIGRKLVITLSDRRLKEFLLNFQFPLDAMFSGSSDTISSPSFQQVSSSLIFKSQLSCHFFQEAP